MGVACTLRIVLEIRSGPHAGRTVLLRRGEELRVGRSAQHADLPCPDDQMSRVHFKVYADRSACYVEDLKSSNGTRVNEQLVGNALLRDGDLITAGQTQFRVRIEGDRPEEAAARETAIRDSAAALLRAVQASQAAYTLEPCDTGLTVFRGSTAQLPPAQIAQLLASTAPLYLIVDGRKLVAPLEYVPADSHLFAWLPAAAAAASPVLLAAAEFAAWPALVAANWGEDAIVCVLSPWDKPQLLAHLRELAQGGDEHRGMLGFCWPSVLASMLSFYRAGFVEAYSQGVQATLVELPDLPDTWQIFAASEFAETLDQLGLARQPNEEHAE